MILFDDNERDYHLPKTECESSYHFFNRSARPAIGLIRDKIESWLSAYPAEHRAELVARFRDDEFFSPWYELFLHQMFLHMGAALEVHPEVGDQNKRPEFLVDLQSTRFVVEAALFNEESVKEKNQSKSLGYVYDEINKLNVPFFLSVHRIVCPAHMQFSPKRIKAFLTRELAQIDPDELIKNNQFHQMPRLKFEDNGASIEFGVLPKSKAGRQKKSRVIGMKTRGFGVTRGSSEHRLRKSLEAKGKKYGKLNMPYLITVNTLGQISLDKSELLGALFGTEQEYVPAGSDECHIRTLDDGFWGTASNPKYTRVSGVLLGMALPWSIPRMELTIFRNPWAKWPLAEIDWPFPVCNRQDDSRLLETGPCFDLASLFGLPRDWPGDLFDNR